MTRKQRIIDIMREGFRAEPVEGMGGIAPMVGGEIDGGSPTAAYGLQGVLVRKVFQFDDVDCGVEGARYHQVLVDLEGRKTTIIEN